MKKKYITLLATFVFVFSVVYTPIYADIVDSQKSEVRIGFYEGENSPINNSEFDHHSVQNKTKSENKFLPRTGSNSTLFLSSIGVILLVLLGIIKRKKKKEKIGEHNNE